MFSPCAERSTRRSSVCGGRRGVEIPFRPVLYSGFESATSAPTEKWSVRVFTHLRMNTAPKITCPGINYRIHIVHTASLVVCIICAFLCRHVAQAATVLCSSRLIGTSWHVTTWAFAGEGWTSQTRAGSTSWTDCRACLE